MWRALVAQCITATPQSYSIVTRKMSASPHFFLRQLFDTKSSTYSYLLADAVTKEAILIDPVLEQVDRDSKLIDELGFKLIYAVNTHVHADHVTGSGSLKKMYPSCKSVISKISGARADVYLKPSDKIVFGEFHLTAAPTPGHTNGCMTYVSHDQCLGFTGDTLLIRGCGRTDFQEGSAEQLYKSVHTHIFSLPDHFKLYPAHDYKGQTCTTVGEEKKFNPRLTKTLPEFLEIMKNLNLAYPKLMDVAVPANKICGIQD